MSLYTGANGTAHNMNKLGGLTVTYTFYGFHPAALAWR